MKPIIDNFLPFTPDRITSIRERRHKAIAEYFANRDKPKARKSSSSPTSPRKAKPPSTPAFSAASQAKLASLDPKTQALVLEALNNAARSQRTRKGKSDGPSISPP